MLALLSCGASAPCPLRPSTRIAVYADESGGVGPGSHAWTHAFWTWWSAANSDLNWVELTEATQVATGCVLADYPELLLYVQPGGDAFNQSQALVRAYFASRLFTPCDNANTSRSPPGPGRA